MLLLSKDFFRLVVISFFIAAPLVYFALGRWLEDFAFRTEIGAGVLAGAGIGTLMIAMTTVSYQAVKASRCNPVDSIRHE